ncbi:protein MLP1 homolog isoform X2 [Thrips palmi]|uniref:Protein MLP1 homolog isoform X2 n=1 Tax=Thrips palmi TaxID=161013 RepID=A0A6P8YCM9_THRPL|nr:protein MLP1 homolog isoform X2 [Thrips palmi]
MENQPEAVVYSKKGRKRAASSAEQPQPKRFQDDAVLEDGVHEVEEQEGGIRGVAVRKVHEAVQVESGEEGVAREVADHKDSTPPGPLVRQDTFTKDDGAATEQFYIPVEQKENSGRREALFKRLAARRKESSAAAATRRAAQAAASKTTSSESRKTKATRRKAQPAPPQQRPETQPPALQRQGTFTIEDDDENPRQQKEQAADLMDPGEDPGEDPDDDATASLKTVAEMRVALAALRRGRAAAERAERAARERASRDAHRTRAALQDLHARLAATREALHAEKDGLHRKLSADFKRAMADREAVWRQERERTTAQVRALETELRTARAQLGSMQADALRKASTTEAELRRAFHDQEAAFRAQIAEVAAQRDSLQAQLRAKDKLAAQDRPASPARGVRTGARPAPRDEALQRSACALRRELQDARKKHALLEAQLKEAQLQAARRPAPTLLDAELARALHAKEQEYRRDAAEAAKKHDAVEAQLRDALRALRDAGGNKAQEKAASRPGKQMTLALESHRQEEEDKEEDKEEAEGHPAAPREQVQQVQPRRRHKRRRQDPEPPEPETEEDDDTQSNEHNDERRRRLLQELERLRERNAALQPPRRVREERRSRTPPGRHPPTDTNAGKGETEEGLMRHFHRLISLEPVSEAEEFPVPGGGLVGLGGPLGGSLGGPQSPLSSGPSSLSPTPGIGDVWNDLAAGCATSSGGSPCSQGGSSGSSSPGGESLGEGGSSSPEQLGAHSVLYWQLMRDHLQLQRAYQQMQQLQAKNNDRQARAKLEAQVYDLKRALSRRPCPALPALAAQTHSHGAALADALQDVVELRQREQALTAELAELRDQNELLEFRLLELEGIVDKSSVCSATRDVCTDTESDTVTEDSGLLSLGASDDGDNHAGPTHQQHQQHQHGDGAAVRDKLALLASSLEAEEDRGCLQRALQLLDSYQQQLNKDAAAKPQSPVKAPNQRIVATVLPFTDVADDAEDLPDAKQSSRDEFRRKQEFFNQIQRLGGSSANATNAAANNNNNNNNNKNLKHADCLQESGIFEEDSEDGVLADLASAATQTEAAWACSCHQSASQSAAAETDAPFSSLPAFGSTAKAHPAAPAATGALSAEIQKLSQIRERFEEHGAVTKLKRPEAPAAAPSALGATQMQLKMRELDFFRSRAALLEDKLAELERCSDPELRGCARLLERVAALERQAREAREAADLLVRRNRDLEEERCELEEAENDTRLRCQQLEVEVVQLREREGALEVELGRARRSLSAAHQLQGRLEMALQSLETRNFELEEAECELRASIAAVESALPAIVAFHLAHYKHYLQQREQRAALPLPAPAHSVCAEDADEEFVDEVDAAAPPAKRDDSEVLERLAQLVAAEQDMHQKIAFLEQKESAFQETLAAADGLWTEMELNYKRRLARAEEAEEELRRKVRRLEDSESKLRQALADQAALSERVHELEAQERVLLARIRSLEQEKQAVAEEADRFHEEMKACRGALQALQERVDGPMAEEAAAERRRALDLAEELRSRQDALAAMEQRTNTEISALQSQIAVGEKTMQDMEVTCAELREEVDTLEEAVGSLRAQLSAAHDKAERDLFRVESALAAKDQQLEELRRDKESPPPALNDEIAAAAQAAQQPEEDDDADEAKPAPPSVSLFRKSLQAFRNSEMMMMMTASKPATPPKPVPKKETDGSKAFASLPPMPTAPAAKRTPPPLPPKNVLALKWPRSDSSAASGR